MFAKFRLSSIFISSLMIASAAHSAEPAKSNKTLLTKYDYPNGYVTEVFKTEVPAKGVAPHHKHPGIESGYILEGGGTLYIKGKDPIQMKPGMTAIVPPDTEHWFVNGDIPSEMVSTYVVKKGEPLMTIINNKK